MLTKKQTYIVLVRRPEAFFKRCHRVVATDGVFVHKPHMRIRDCRVKLSVNCVQCGLLQARSQHGKMMRLKSCSGSRMSPARSVDNRHGLLGKFMQCFGLTEQFNSHSHTDENLQDVRVGRPSVDDVHDAERMDEISYISRASLCMFFISRCPTITCNEIRQRQLSVP